MGQIAKHSGELDNETWPLARLPSLYRLLPVSRPYSSHTLRTVVASIDRLSISQSGVSSCSCEGVAVSLSIHPPWMSCSATVGVKEEEGKKSDVEVEYE